MKLTLGKMLRLSLRKTCDIFTRQEFQH